ncbi:hypothetical protein D3C87_1678820 [compost metagenome]
MATVMAGSARSALGRSLKTATSIVLVSAVAWHAPQVPHLCIASGSALAVLAVLSFVGGLAACAALCS